MMKVVLILDINDEKTKQKVLKKVSGLLGIASISMDMEKKKLTVIGNADPVLVVCKVRKVWPSAEILSIGPEKVETKKKEPEKEEAKTKNQNELIADLWKQYGALHCHPITPYYYHF